MGKYTQEVKDKAVQMCMAGVSFVEIQKQLGPNPKAVMRYLDAAGLVKPVKKQKSQEGEISKRREKSQKEISLSKNSQHS